MMRPGRPKYHSVFYKYVIVKNGNGSISLFDIRKPTMITQEDEIILYKKDQIEKDSIEAKALPIPNEIEESEISNVDANSDGSHLPRFNSEALLDSNDNLILHSNLPHLRIDDFDISPVKIDIKNDFGNIVEFTNYFGSSIDVMPSLPSSDQYTGNFDFEIFKDNLSVANKTNTVKINASEPADNLDHNLI